MRIVSFAANREERIGVRVGQEVVDLSVAAPGLPRSMNALLAGGPKALQDVKSAAASAKREAFLKLADVRLLPPNPHPSKILCLGVNFLSHAKEAGLDKPDFPPVFMRGPSSLVAPGAPIVKPNNSDQLDYECELAIVIGRTARHVAQKDALDYVAGYSAFNDGSVRDYQLRTSQWTLGKNFDGTGAFGPELVTPDELPPGATDLRIQTRLNGVVMQDANTNEMIYGTAATIEYLSGCLTLYPGDVIIMGTCEGVGLLRKPPVFMKHGDVCEIEIEKIGILTNPIVREEPSAH